MMFSRQRFPLASVALALFLVSGTASLGYGVEPPPGGSPQETASQEPPVGLVYPAAETVGDDFLGGAQAIDEAIQSTLPFGKAMVGNRIDELPLPVGITFTYEHQWDRLRITRLDITSKELGNIAVPPSYIEEINASTNTYALMLDAWVLPFWNVYGILAYSDGTAEVDAVVPGVLDYAIDEPYSAFTYGGGTVVTAGWRDFFVIGNFTWTTQEVNVLESRVNVFLAAPRIGWQSTIGPASVALWAGANYLHMGQHLYGTTSFDIPGLGNTNLNFDLDIEQVGAWNTALGGRVSLGKRFDLVLEGGIGRRRSILTALAFRF